MLLRMTAEENAPQDDSRRHLPSSRPDRNFLPPLFVPAGMSKPEKNSRHPAACRALLVLVGLALSACHPGNEEARRLRSSCEAGDAAACNKFAVKLQKAEYVLRAEARAAGLFDTACTGGVGEGCASLGLMLQHTRAIRRDSARAVKLFQRGCERGAVEG